MRNKIKFINKNYKNLSTKINKKRLKNIVKHVERNSSLKIRDIKEIKPMSYNHIFEINNNLILKIPNKLTNTESIINTIKLEQLIEKKTKIKSPHIAEYHVSQIPNKSFYIYNKINGKDLHFTNRNCFNDEFIGDKLAKQIARILKSIHGIDKNSFKFNDSVKHSKYRFIREKNEIYKFINTLDSKKRKFTIDLVKNLSSKTTKKTCIHGDLNKGNILTNNRYKITGIVDFESICIGDPDSDFSSLYDAFGEYMLNRILAYYKKRNSHELKKKLISLIFADIINNIIRSKKQKNTQQYKNNIKLFKEKTKRFHNIFYNV